MPQDLFTIKRYASKLNNLITGAKVNKITEPNPDEVILSLYGGKTFNLTVNASAKFCRVSLTNLLKENPAVAFNFCMLLRKHLTSATVLSVETLNDDRIIAINFKSTSELFDNQTVSLIAEIMGKYSNVFLVKNGIILGTLKTPLQTLDLKRVNLVKSKYVLPEKQNKLSACNLENLKLCFKAFKNGDLSLFILQSFYDFSPVTAKELAHRILTKNNGVFNSEIAITETQNFINEKSAPTVIINENSSDFYALNYESLQGEKLSFSCILDAMSYYYYSAENSLYITAKQNALMQKVSAQEKKLLKKQTALLDKLKEGENSEIFKLYGELLTAYSHTVKKGQTTANLVNYYSENGEVLTIPLNENLSAIENAQSYYKKYSKHKNTALKTKPQLDKIEQELKYLETVKLSISISKDKLEFLEIEEELTTNTSVQVKKSDKKQPKKVAKSSYLRYEIDGFSVIVGKNNVQNDRLFKETNSLDIWLHVKNQPSCHAYILTNNNQVSIETILKVAEICACYSKAKNEQKVEVDYTLKKHVKKQSGGALGAVTYTDFKTVIVTPNEHENLKKMQ